VFNCKTVTGRYHPILIIHYEGKGFGQAVFALQGKYLHENHPASIYKNGQILL
jgi:hypothetical protein